MPVCTCHVLFSSAKYPTLPTCHRCIPPFGLTTMPFLQVLYRYLCRSATCCCLTSGEGDPRGTAILRAIAAARQALLFSPRRCHIPMNARFA
ncbi:hypothetical protein NPIL_58891 [Nephila pilipes]|uniref:Uncharacterized protein n=1 Tax=Nephila pilipes TaxID=299642 RepID=A0A8X6PWU9_NEPPI|nr:hypothetical protein NPIL_58891 [Nephila pilipes]